MEDQSGRRIRYVGLIRILLLPNGRRALATIDEDVSWELVEATPVGEGPQ